MTKQTVEEMFLEAAGQDREAMVSYAQMVAIQQLETELKAYAQEHENNPDWTKFASLIARAYTAIDMESDEKEEVISDHLGLTGAGSLRKYITGEYQPHAPQVAHVCNEMAYLLRYRESKHLTDGIQRSLAFKQDRKLAMGQ